MRAYAMMAIAVAITLHAVPAPERVPPAETGSRIVAVVFWPLAAFSAAAVVHDRWKADRAAQEREG